MKRQEDAWWRNGWMVTSLVGALLASKAVFAFDLHFIRGPQQI